MKTFRLPIRAVLYRDEGRWIAHCLEFDVIGDGKDVHSAVQSLSEAIATQVEHTLSEGDPANLFTPADGKFFQMFAAGRNIAEGELNFKLEEIRDGIEIERMDAREFDADPVCA